MRPVTSDRQRNWLRVFAGMVALWAMLTGLILLEIVPYTPKSFRGWALLLTGGPPVYLALSWLGERVLGPRLGRISPTRFSVAWFAWMLVAILVGSAVVALSALVALSFGP